MLLMMVSCLRTTKWDELLRAFYLAIAPIAKASSGKTKKICCTTDKSPAWPSMHRPAIAIARYVCVRRA